MTIPRKRIPLCTICGEWSRYRARLDGHAQIQGITVKISAGDPVCLTHVAHDLKGRPMLIDEKILVDAPK